MWNIFLFHSFSIFPAIIEAPKCFMAGADILLSPLSFYNLQTPHHYIWLTVRHEPGYDILHIYGVHIAKLIQLTSLNKLTWG